jgi:acyl-coenzyme A synthetase/AMP-(fatty) acid ligase
MARRGLIVPGGPLRTLRQLHALLHWGTSLAGELVSAAARDPDRPALIDERGECTYAELDDRTDRLAAALVPDTGARRPRVAMLCRNHRGLAEALVACSKRGAEVVLLGTGLGAEAMRTAIRELWADLVIADAEFTGVLPTGRRRSTEIIAWPGKAGSQEAGARDTIDELIGRTPRTRLEPPPTPGRTVFFSSGTTGAPKGTVRPPRPGVMPLAGMLWRAPMRVGDTMLIEAPLFHAWGHSCLQIALALRATVVVRRRLSPEELLDTVQKHRCTTLITVPRTLQRLLELPAATRVRYDTSSLRLAIVSGARLPGRLATDFMDAFPAQLCNVYGSTEAGWVSVATAAQLRADPGTAGLPVSGATIAILDAAGRPVRRGETGEIFTHNRMCLEGYTGGVRLDTHRGMIPMGDVGHLNKKGLLRIEGRVEEAIVSEGKHLYPGVAEDAIAGLPGVREVAVIGVPDQPHGARLAAFVVVAPGGGPDAETVRACARHRLASPAMPCDVHFLAELPRDALGKIILHRLQSLARRGA